MAVIAPGPYPRLLAAGYDARLRTGVFKFTWTNPYQRSDYFGWVGQITRYGGTDDGLYFNSVSQAGEFAIRSWQSGAMAWSLPFTWTVGSPITFTFDVPNSTVTIAGALTGNGIYTGRSMAWALGDGTLRIGEYTSGNQVVDPMIGLIEDVATGTTLQTTSAIAAAAALAATARWTQRIASAITAAATVAATPSGQTTVQITAAITSSAAITASAKLSARTSCAIDSLSALAGAATARVPSPYEATAFQSYPQYPPGNTLITNRWPTGQPLLVRDRVGREVVCPVRSADGRMYLAISENQGATWRFVGHTIANADPLWNQNLLVCKQDTAGKYHLLSHDPNEGVVYTRFVLARDGAQVVTGYTREVHIYQVFGSDASTEHVADLVVARRANGTECLVIQNQDGFNSGMTVYAMKTLTTTPTLASHFTKLDGTAGRTELVAPLPHNGHEHVSRLGFFESNGNLVSVRSHSAAEGFTDATYYNDLYRMVLTRSGDTWSLGSWQRYQQPGEGLHTRSHAMADGKMFLMVPCRDSGLHISSIDDAGNFTLDAVPKPGQTYEPQSPYFYEADGGIAVSRDGTRIYLYVQSYRSENERAGFFADWSAAGGWRRDESAAYTPPWQNYSCSVSTGDGFGLYVARSDGPYGNTTPALAGYRALGPNLSTTVSASALPAASAQLEAVLSARVAAAASVAASSALSAAGRASAATTAAVSAASTTAAVAGAGARAAAELSATSSLAGVITATGYATSQAHMDATGALAGVLSVARSVGAELACSSNLQASALVGARAEATAAVAATSALSAALRWGQRIEATAELVATSALEGASGAQRTVQVVGSIQAHSLRWRPQHVE